MFFASASDLDPSWLSNAFTFLCAAAALYATFRKPRGEVPQPLITRPDAEWATAEGVRNLSQRVKGVDDDIRHLREAVHEREKQYIKDAESRSSEIYDALHERLAPISQCLHDLTGQVKELATQVHAINAKLLRPERKA